MFLPLLLLFLLPPPLSSAAPPPSYLRPSAGLAGGAQPLSAAAVPIKVCFQGEAGAYSEKSLRELLGPSVISVARKSFEDCFRAVSSSEADYCLLPVENSLGGSIHENYDLMLRYDLAIVAEHDFKVSHCLLRHPAADMAGVKFAISHPQALAQCQNYLRNRGIEPVGTYDTAGSAKMISEGRGLPDGCTRENTVAIASDLAGEHYGLTCEEVAVEDDPENFTRFLLLSRQGVSHLLSKKIPSKTSVVFTLPESAGALYKALACFSLREVDFSKIESRPTSASLLQYLRFRGAGEEGKRGRFRYCFYLDFLDHELGRAAQNSLQHLAEQAEFVRVLGSYPRSSRLVGAVRDQVDALAGSPSNNPSSSSLSSDSESAKLRVGVVGYGRKVKRLAERLKEQGHEVTVLAEPAVADRAANDGFDSFPLYESGEFLTRSNLDVVFLTAPLISFETTLASLPPDLLAGKLVVSLTPLMDHVKDLLLTALPPSADLVVANAMVDTGGTLTGAPFVYEKVRVTEPVRCDRLVKMFNDVRMRPVELDAAAHDRFTGGSQFITSLVGRLLNKQQLRPSPVNTRGYENLEKVVDEVENEDDDEFYALWKFSEGSSDQVRRLRDALSDLEKQLSAKDSYQRAKLETRGAENQKMMAEVQSIVREALKAERGGGEGAE